MVPLCQDSDQARANVGNGVGQGDFYSINNKDWTEPAQIIVISTSY